MKIRKSIIYAIIASILWALVNPFIKYGMSFDLTPMNFAGMRFSLAGLFLMVFTAHRGMFKEILNHKRMFTLLILVNIFIGYAAFYMGVHLTAAAISSIVMGMTPLINVVLAHFIAHSDRLDRRKLISLAIAFAGLMLIISTGDHSHALSLASIIGICLLFVSITAQGYSAIKVAEYHVDINPVFMNGVQMFFGGVLLYIFGLGTEGYHSFLHKPISFYLCFAALVAISIFAFSIWFIALKDKSSKVSELNMCRLINPVLGAVISWIMIPDEYPTFSTIAGMIIIVSSLLIYFRGDKQDDQNIITDNK